MHTQNTQQTLVQHTQHKQNTQNKLRTIMHAKQQNAMYAKSYTAQQHAQVNALALAAQAQYFTKRIYTNFRKKFCTVTIYNTTSVCLALTQIATKHNAKIVVTQDRKSTRLNSSHVSESRMPSSA